MRIPKTWVRPLTGRIIHDLLENRQIEPLVAPEKLLDEAEAIIFGELSVEDRLNEEVREILKRYDSEIEKGRVDYKSLFDRVKQKLVQERNIVL